MVRENEGENAMNWREDEAEKKIVRMIKEKKSFRIIKEEVRKRRKL